MKPDAKHEVTFFESTHDGLVLLDTALVKGLSEQTARELIAWMVELQKNMLKPRSCPFCGVSV